MRGSRAKGLTYEKKVGRTLKRWQREGELAGELLLGPWFSFWDEGGHGYCQPDALIITSSFVFILECKLSFTDFAWPQLRRLYKPVVEKVFERPAITIQVCRNLYIQPAGLIESLQKTMDDPSSGCLTWHFLGA